MLISYQIMVEYQHSAYDGTEEGPMIFSADNEKELLFDGGMQAKMDGPLVEGYHGWVVVNGKRYTKDVIIHADGSVTERKVELSRPYRSDYFHVPISEKELDFLEQERPEVIIIGTGFKAMMLATPRAKEILDKYETHLVSTQKALEMINETKRRFVAILHLTC